MRYNSTIIPKKRKLDCGCFDYPFSKNRCKMHATIEDTHKRITEFVEKEEGLPELITEADELFSKYIRLKNADKNGNVICYTCGNELRWQDSQCGHYISRSCLFLRWDDRNVRVQDNFCNCIKHGNLAIFGQKLEQEHSGITEILYEESKIIYKPTREEMKNLITELKIKLKSWKQ